MAPAIRGKRRCRMHGGRSTGPRTPKGLTHSQRARWVHGRYSVERVKARRAALDRAAADLWDEYAAWGLAHGFVPSPVRYRNVAGVQLHGTAHSRQLDGPGCMLQSVSVERRHHSIRARKADSGNG